MLYFKVCSKQRKLSVINLKNALDYCEPPVHLAIGSGYKKTKLGASFFATEFELNLKMTHWKHKKTETHKKATLTAVTSVETNQAPNYVALPNAHLTAWAKIKLSNSTSEGDEHIGFQ